MSLRTTRLKLSLQRAKTKRALAASIAALVIVGVGIAAWVYTHQNNSESQARSKADSLVRALEAHDVNRAVSLAGASTQNAGYYSQIAIQLGSEYKIIKSTSKKDKDNILYSFIYKAEKSRRPGTIFIRIIIEESKDKVMVDSVFPNATEPSAFPS